MEGIAQLTPLILIFVIFYFLRIRHKQKRVKDHKNMVAQLKRGDQVVTSGGIVGRIERILEDDKVELTIAENVNIKVVKSTIQSLSEKTEKKK